MSTSRTVPSFLLALSLIGCAAAIDDSPSTSALRQSQSEACANKTCGADCSPAGSDEPFNCSAQGKCVAIGTALGCGSTCPEFLGDCGQGTEPADLNGDGCIDGCKPTAPPSPCAGKACGVDCSPAGSDEPFNCSAQGKCVAAGTPLGCGPACPEFLGDCAQGTAPADLDGDGCIDGCKPTPPPSPCAGKTCGADCSPPGSDEPFNCSVQGKCVAAGTPLGC